MMTNLSERLRQLSRPEKARLAGLLAEKQHRTARRSLIAYTEATLPGYAAAGHHRRIAERLEAIERGEIDRLLVVMPPRHGKSELASRRYPAWYLGRHPDRQIIAASYNSDLAADFGRAVRNLMGSSEHRAVFPGSTLAPDSAAANRWHTGAGGSYVAAGVGTAITGRGAHVLLIDDPIKGREDAESETYRERLWNWYRAVAYTRLMPGGSIVLIQTRWYEDDLAGRLLAEMERGGDRWEVLHLSARSETGEALWPEWYPAGDLARIRAAIGPREWQALYQGDPTPDEGSYFRRDWIRYYDDPPEHMRTYGASDYAVTNDGGDYTVHRVVGVDPKDDIYVLDWWRGQTDSDRWIDAMLDLMKRHEPLIWAEEAGQIGKSLGPFIVKRQMERKVYGRREQFVSATDKPTRARSIQARMSMGKVYLPCKASWTPGLVSELLKFPAGKHDNQVDVMSLFGRMLAALAKGVVPPAAKEPSDMHTTPWTSCGRHRSRGGGGSVTPKEFRGARDKLGLSLSAMASELGVHPRTICKWQSGSEQVPASIARLIHLMIATPAPRQCLTGRIDRHSAPAHLAATMRESEGHDTSVAAVADPIEVGGDVERWDAELRAYERVTETWRKDAKRIVERYSLKRRDSERHDEPQFNILWSNIQTILPSLFAREPILVVERRHRDPDPVGRIAAQVLERALAAETEQDDLSEVFQRVVLDTLLTGRGVPWVRYDADIARTEVPLTVNEDGLLLNSDGALVDYGDAERRGKGFLQVTEEVASERAPVDYVYWQDFYHKPAKNWEELTRDGWIARRVYMTRRQGLERFGEAFRDVPLSGKPEGMADDVSDQIAPIVGLAEVFEIWNAADREVIWLCRGHKHGPLDKRPDRWASASSSRVRSRSTRTSRTRA